ncbi:hypothetical protein NDU88_008438 [Pleurodeles waltl]|uniref:Uncharacterized protein n=1 Tax=Pleurodeles waltl TaxID=8319 RepID=A0AAV7PS51_PLEWA|nr:hypothetical protein NDU88_008438 [Pleurodeles waltl]
MKGCRADEEKAPCGERDSELWQLRCTRPEWRLETGRVLQSLLACRELPFTRTGDAWPLDDESGHRGGLEPRHEGSLVHRGCSSGALRRRGELSPPTPDERRCSEGRGHPSPKERGGGPNTVWTLTGTDPGRR